MSASTCRGSGGSFHWYDSPDGTNPIGTDAQLTTPLLDASTSYYVSYVSAGGCESDRVQAIASVLSFSPTILASTVDPQVCVGGIHMLVAKGAPSGSTYQWFDAVDSNTVLGEGNQFATDSLKTSGSYTYYVKAKSTDGCLTDPLAVEAKVASSPVTPSISTTYDPICQNGQTTIKITNSDPLIPQYRWYQSLTDQQPIYEGTQLRTEALGDNTSYYVAAVDINECQSTDRKQVAVVVYQYPDPIIIDETATLGQLKSSFTSGNQWFLNNSPIIGETNQTLAITGPGVYDLLVTTAPGCVDEAGAVYATTLVTGIEDIPREITVYPNPVSNILKVFIEGQEEVSAVLFDEKGVAVNSLVLQENAKGWEGELDVRAFQQRPFTF